MTAPTSRKLADALKAAGFAALATRAEADEFHEYFSPHGVPLMVLADELSAIIRTPSFSPRATQAAANIRARLIDGEFDASDEESDEWAGGEEGQETFRKLIEGE